MPAMYLVCAAVVGVQQPAVPPQAARALARAQAALAAAQPTMARLGTMLNSDGLAQLEELDGQLAALGIALAQDGQRSEEHTSELQSRLHLVCRLLLEKKKKVKHYTDVA